MKLLSGLASGPDVHIPENLTLCPTTSTAEATSTTFHKHPMCVLYTTGFDPEAFWGTEEHTNSGSSQNTAIKRTRFFVMCEDARDRPKSGFERRNRPC